MASITHTAARLDVTVGLNDDLTLEVTVEDGDGAAIDVSGWTLEGDHCTPSIVDGPNGRIDLSMRSTTAGVFTWGLKRTSSPKKRLLRGSLHVTESASSDTATSLTLQVTDDQVSVTVEDTGTHARGDGTLSTGDLARVKSVSPLTLEALPSPSDGDAPVYDAASGLWVPDSGTYRKSAESVWIAASGMHAVVNSPTRDRIAGRWPIWSFANGNREDVASSLKIPDGWSSIRVFLYWTNLSGSESGDVNLRAFHASTGAGEWLGSDAEVGQKTVTAPAQNDLEITDIGTKVVDPSDANLLRVARQGGASDDTLSAAAGLVGVRVDKES